MSDLSRARELVDLHLPLVCGAALKLAIDGVQDVSDERLRCHAGLTAYHWALHSSRVIRLAASLRSILPPT